MYEERIENETDNRTVECRNRFGDTAISTSWLTTTIDVTTDADNW